MSKKEKFARIIRGEDRDIPLRTTESDGSPRALGDPDEMIARFENEDRTTLELKLTTSAIVITNDEQGKFDVKLTDAQTDLLRLVERPDLIVEITKGTVTRKAKFLRAYSVEADNLDT